MDLAEDLLLEVPGENRELPDCAEVLGSVLTVQPLHRLDERVVDRTRRDSCLLSRRLRGLAAEV